MMQQGFTIHKAEYFHLSDTHATAVVDDVWV